MPKMRCGYLCLAASFLLTTGQPRRAHATADLQRAFPDGPQPQDSASPPASLLASALVTPPEEITLRGTPKRLLSDQKAIWTSPLHLRPKDAEWLIPLGVATGLLIGSDQHTMTSAIHINPDGQKKANTISTGGVAALGAVHAGYYEWSSVNQAPQARETGLLAGEALANSLAVNEAFKFVFRRGRPLVNNAAGNFFSSSFSDSSFPSNHAIAAWSIASVVGEEYPGWLTRTAVYGLASTVSVSRVLAEKHFPPDVLVGSAAGWLIGHYVYKAHHDYSLTPFNRQPLHLNYGASPVRTMPANMNAAAVASMQQSASTLQQTVAHLPPDPIPNRPPLPFDPDPDTIGSTNVPMDSWIYPALERLAAMGLIPGQSISIRP